MPKLEDLDRPFDPYRPRELKFTADEERASLVEAREQRQRAAQVRAKAIMAKMVRKGQLSDG